MLDAGAVRDDRPRARPEDPALDGPTLDLGVARARRRCSPHRQRPDGAVRHGRAPEADRVVVVLVREDRARARLSAAPRAGRRAPRADRAISHDMEVTGIAIGLLGLTAATSWWLTGRLARAPRFGTLDLPNERSLHAAPVARTGGLAIIATL